jgi:hypothetical protein
MKSTATFCHLAAHKQICTLPDKKMRNFACKYLKVGIGNPKKCQGWHFFRFIFYAMKSAAVFLLRHYTKIYSATGREVKILQYTVLCKLFEIA